MPQLKAIFYDMDGTLVFFIIDYILARRRAIEELIKQGIPNPNGMFSPNIPSRVTLNLARNYMEHTLKFSPIKIRRVMNRVHERIVEVEREAAYQAKMVNQMEDLLRFGKKNNIKQIVCTFNTHEVAEITLKTAGLCKYIDAIYGRDDVNNPKPHPDHLEIPAKRFGFTPEESIFIGDMEFDILAAKRFGCLAMGIRTDFEINTIEKADFIIDQQNASEEILKLIHSKFQI